MDSLPARPLAVVVVTYNSANVIGGCLEALPVALSGVADWQAVVVDNASADATVELAEAAGAKVVRRLGNDGFAAGVNAGIAAAPGCDVLVLNADVRLEPGAVATMRAAVRPGIGIVGPKLVDENGAVQHSVRREPTPLRVLGQALLGGTTAGKYPALGEIVVQPGETSDWITGAAWLVTAECIDAIGTLDERYLLYSEETEYMLRARDKGFATRYVPEAVAVHLGGESETSSRLWALLQANRVRLHRERHGRAQSVLMWFAVALNELLR
ncbi:MAG TPA: glycosyltransferase family 2 protein, partial [Lentzea sp.]